jgi:hypothetical protein
VEGDLAIEEGGVGLEPAGEWVKYVAPYQDLMSTHGLCSKYFRGGECARILLGPDEILRDKIPKDILCNSSKYFRNHYRSMERKGKCDINTVRIPDVNPELFDLAMQYTVTKSIMLKHGTTNSVEIKVSLDLIFSMLQLGLPDPSKLLAERIRKLLIEARQALKPKHVQRAYNLRKGHPMRQLFVQASIKEYMTLLTSGPKYGNIRPADDISDHEDMCAANYAAFSAGRFRFQKELENISEFEIEVLKEQDRVLKSGEKIPQPRKKSTAVTTYTDPLDGSQFYL